MRRPVELTLSTLTLQFALTFVLASHASPEISIDTNKITIDCGQPQPQVKSTSTLQLFRAKPSKSDNLGTWEVEIKPEDINALQGQEGLVQFESVPLSDGTSDTFTLSRLRPFSPDCQIYEYNGKEKCVVPAPNAAYFVGRSTTNLNRSITLCAVNQSEVWMFVTSDTGSTILAPSGYGDLAHVLADPKLLIAGDPFCHTNEIMQDAASIAASQKSSHRKSLQSSTLELEVLVDVAFGLYSSSFNSNSNATTAYVGSLFAAVSAIFLRDCNIGITIKELVLWTSPDPFSGNSTYEQLSSYHNYNYQSRSNIERDTCHLLAGKTEYGGRASIGIGCGNSFNNGGVSNIHGKESFPIFDYSWDTNLVAHELGHNLGSLHTHCYEPPIDCCYTECTVCPQQVREVGTIMSYCHAYGRGVELKFHARTIDVIRAYAESLACIGGFQDSRSFTIFNFGDTDLEIYDIVAESSEDWLVISPTAPFVVTPGGRRAVVVNSRCGYIPPGGASVSLQVLSNDDDEPEYPEPIVIEVLSPSCLCKVTSDTDVSYPARDKNGEASIDAPDGCFWSASSDSPWIHMKDGGIGSGPGRIRYYIEENHSISARTGHIFVKGQMIRVTQDAIDCKGDLYWPYPGEVWRSDREKAVRWNSDCLVHNRVHIELWKAGSLVRILVTNTKNDGKEKVLLASVLPGRDYRIRIVSAFDSGIWLETDGNFRVKGGS